MAISKKIAAIAASGALVLGVGTATVLTGQANTPPANLATSNNVAQLPESTPTPTPVPTYTVSVVTHGATTKVTITQPTVAAALKAAGVVLDSDDRVAPALTSTVKTGDRISVARVTMKDTTSTAKVAPGTTKVKDATLAAGTTKTKTAGKPGTKSVVTRTVTVDGTVESAKVLKSTVTKAATDKVVLVGTKPQPEPVRKTTTTSRSTEREAVSTGSTSGAGLNLARASMWDRIAKCESGNNWSINTGNGYYGGLQFNVATWRGVGGGDFAAYPHQASRAEQITVANRLYAQRGLQPWGCRHAA